MTMNYLLKRGNMYYFNRRVPLDVKQYDTRSLVRVALKTDSRKEALRLALDQNESLEAYWRDLILTNSKHQIRRYEAVVQEARLHGFAYRPNHAVAGLQLNEIIKRLEIAEANIDCEETVAGVLGGMEEPAVLLSDTLDQYMAFAKSKTLNKSDNQLRKWSNPRKLAMKTFIDCIGDKELRYLTRDDMIKYRDWWITRIEKGKVLGTTANKNLVHIKSIIETVNDNLKLNLDARHLFRRILLDADDERKRLPFESDYIVSTLLNPQNLNGLNHQAKWALYAIAETGAGISEQVGLLPEDIVLDADNPHIIIQPRQKKALKTKYRKRIIPLVGFALDAFKACPEGFTEYRERPDSLSCTLSKYLKENDLLPTDQHTVYSLRHSFQDRLLAVNAPDRVQADLMGHKFNRQAYGNGASLEQKLEWLNVIALKKISHT